MNCAHLSLQLPSDLLHRLENVTLCTDQTVDACVIQALEEYVQTWEEFQRCCTAVEVEPPFRGILRQQGETGPQA